MEKRFVNAAIAYTALGLAGGVFYREYTKALGFSGTTALSVVHAHYLMLGMAMFLLFALLDHTYHFSALPGARGWVIAYHVGLNVTLLGLLARGLTDVWGAELSRGVDASISGVSGLGHLILGVSLIAVLLCVRKKAATGHTGSSR